MKGGISWLLDEVSSSTVAARVTIPTLTLAFGTDREKTLWYPSGQNLYITAKKKHFCNLKKTNNWVDYGMNMSRLWVN